MLFALSFLLLADGAAAPSSASWLTPELATFLGLTLASLVVNLLQHLGKKELAAKVAAAAPLVGAMSGAIATVRRDGALGPAGEQALIGALKRTGHELGVSTDLDALAQLAKAAPGAAGALDAATKVLAPPPATAGVVDVVRRITGRA
jgi:hypothetical protein